MKTVSTKVNESVYQKLIESCGKSGNCISEKIRNLIEESLVNSQNKESTITENEHESHYDKYGNYWTWNKDKAIWIASTSMVRTPCLRTGIYCHQNVLASMLFCRKFKIGESRILCGHFHL